MIPSPSTLLRRSYHLALVAGACLAVACGGPPAQAPVEPPPLDDPSGPSGGGFDGTPSSHAVKEAMAAIEAGDYAAAKQKAEAARAADPKDPQAAFYLGVALEGTGDAAGAREAYRAALALAPTLADAAVNLSALLLDAGEAAAALKVVRAGLAKTPKHPGLVMNQAMALEALGERDAALVAYAEAVEALPAEAELRFAYARLLAEAGRKDEAIAQLGRVESEDAAVLGAVAETLGKLGAYAQCVGVLDPLLAAKPTADVHVRRGICRHGVGDEPGARQDFQAAIKLDGGFAPAHFYLGQSLRAEPKLKREAIAAFEAALKAGAGTKWEAAAKKELAALGVTR